MEQYAPTSSLYLYIIMHSFSIIAQQYRCQAQWTVSMLKLSTQKLLYVKSS